MLDEAMREKRAGTGDGALEVRVWLRLLSYSMTVEKRLRRKMEQEFGTTLPRFDVLAALERAGDTGLTMGELSAQLLVSNGNVTALVKQLRSDELVVSQPSREDARSTITKLTEQGRHAFGQMAQAHHSWIMEGMTHMEPEKLEALYNLLADLKNPKEEA